MTSTQSCTVTEQAVVECTYITPSQIHTHMAAVYVRVLAQCVHACVRACVRVRVTLNVFNIIYKTFSYRQIIL